MYIEFGGEYEDIGPLRHQGSLPEEERFGLVEGWSVGRSVCMDEIIGYCKGRKKKGKSGFVRENRGSDVVLYMKETQREGNGKQRVGKRKEEPGMAFADRLLLLLLLTVFLFLLE